MKKLFVAFTYMTLLPTAFVAGGVLGFFLVMSHADQFMDIMNAVMSHIPQPIAV